MDEAHTNKKLLDDFMVDLLFKEIGETKEDNLTQETVQQLYGIDELKTRWRMNIGGRKIIKRRSAFLRQSNVTPNIVQKERSHTVQIERPSTVQNEEVNNQKS